MTLAAYKGRCPTCGWDHRDNDLTIAYLCGKAERTAWEPIETAPKDGTHVLIKRMGGLPATCHWFDGGWHLSVNQRGEFSAWVWGDPTHWTALPSNAKVSGPA